MVRVLGLSWADTASLPFAAAKCLDHMFSNFISLPCSRHRRLHITPQRSPKRSAQNDPNPKTHPKPLRTAVLSPTSDLRCAMADNVCLARPSCRYMQNVLLTVRTLARYRPGLCADHAYTTNITFPE